MDEAVCKLILEGKTGWINTKSKTELLNITNDLNIQLPDQCTLEEIRIVLRNYIKVNSKFYMAKQTNMAASAWASLEHFAGGNFDSYLQQFDCYVLINDIPEEKKLPLLITKLNQATYEKLTHLCAPKAPIKYTYDEVITKLKDYFHPKKNVSILRAQFKDRRQQTGESIKEYLLALRGLAKDCGFQNLEEELKERLLNGVINETIRYELLKIGDTSFENIQKTAETAEMAFQVCKQKEKPVEVFKVEKRGPPLSDKSSSKCFCCGKIGHRREQCTLRNKFCSECGARGHIFKRCMKKIEQSCSVKHVSEEIEEKISQDVKELKLNDQLDQEEPYNVSCNLQTNNRVQPVYLNVSINSQMLSFEVDTGSDVSVITFSDKNKYLPHCKLHPTNVKMINFNQSISEPCGVIKDLTVSFGSVECMGLKIFVMPDNHPRIIGKDLLHHLKLWPPKIEQHVNSLKLIECYEKQIKKDFSSVFESGWGNCKGAEITLKLKPDSKPKFCTARNVPFAIKSKVNDEIDRLLKAGRIEPVQYSDWGTPVVPVLKKDGSVRLCGDYKTTLNQSLEVDHFPLPTVNDIISNFQGNSYFCELDLKEAYLQAPLSRESQELTTIVTEKVEDHEAEAGISDVPPILETGNGDVKMLKRMETVPDIKRDTSGITTQYIAAGIVNLGAFAAGVSVAWSSSALPLLTPGPAELDNFARSGDFVAPANGTHPRLQLTEYEASWVASLLCLGAVFGSVPAGLISEYFGRKKTLLYLALPLVVSWILVASSPNVYGLYVGRFVAGVAVGAFSVAIPPYVADVAEKQLWPTLANFYHVHFAGGVLFGYIIGMVQSTTWLSILCASIPTAFFIAFIFLPESPAYYMSQGKTSEAKAALRYFRGIDNDIDSELKMLKENIRNYARNRVTFKQLFQTRSTVKALFVSFSLMIFQQMSGIYPVLFYAEKIFKFFSISLNPPGAAIILGFCLVSSTYFSTMLLRSFRRRVLLMISFILMAISLGTLAIYYHMKAANLHSSSTWVPLFTLCMYVTVYAMGVGPIPWLMLREIFPANVTRRASAITAGFHWFLAFGATKLYQNLVENIGPGWTLWHFAVTCIVATIFIYFFVPETKGKTFEEIQKEFDGIHKKKKHRHVIEVESLSDA